MVHLSVFIAKKISRGIPGKGGFALHLIIMGFIYWFLCTGLVTVAGFIIPKENFVGRFCDMDSYGHISIKAEYAEIFLVVILCYFMLFLILYIVGESISSQYFRMGGSSNTFGSARFSDVSEVMAAGLKGDGIIFGKMGKNIVAKPPFIEGHVLITGGTGTGKSRGVVIPSLLRWQGAALVMDIKGELSRITSDRRKIFGKVYIFNPEGNGDCYNPIAQCTTIDQAQDLARTLIPLPLHGDPFWAQSAQAILSAFVFEGAHKGKTLSDIAETLCVTPIDKLVEHCRNNSIREVRLLASITYDLPDKTLGGIMGELKSKLITLATDPNIHRATRQADWTPQSLEEGATIYLRVSEHLLEQYKSILTVIISQTLKYLSTRPERKIPPVLVALDEMPRLSKIDGLTNALATLRSRNVHIMSIIQSMAQLDMIYGLNDRKVIADNCRYKLILSATDPETQKYFSDLTGQKTVMSKGKSTSGFRVSSSKTEQGTPLIRPEEWANLRQPILLAPGLYPIPVNLAYWDIEKF